MAATTVHLDGLRTPDDWFALGEAIFREVTSFLQRYGVDVDPALRFERSEAPSPSYRPSTRTIRFGVPDPTTPKGRLYWYFVQHLTGAPDLAAVQRAIELPLPWAVAHEVGHHLRDYYGAPIDNNFVEEQVVDCVAIALIGEHPRYRQGLGDLRQWAQRVSERSRQLSPGTAPYLAGFRLDVGDVLVAQGKLGLPDLAEVRRLAETTGATVEDVLRMTRRATAGHIARAREERARAETYFNQRYMAGVAEYWLFGTDWLARYLERDDLPPFGEALKRYVLTADWETSRRDATRLFLEQALRSDDDEIAIMAAAALADQAGTGAIGALVAALADERHAVQGAALRALGELPGAAPAAAPRVTLLLSSNASVRGPAARFLRRSGFPVPLSEDAPPEQRAEAALARLPDDRTGAYDVLGELLDGDHDSVVAALAAFREVGPGPHLTRVVSCLASTAVPLRVAAARALAGCAAAAPAVISSLADPDPDVRLAARDAVSWQDPATWPQVRESLQSMPWPLRIELLSHAVLAGVPEAPATLIDLAGAVLRRARALARLEARSRGIEWGELLSLAIREERWRLARLALRAIGTVASPAGLEIVERALESPDPRDQAGGRDLVRMSMGRRGRTVAALLEPEVTHLPPGEPGAVLRACATAESEVLRVLAAFLAVTLLEPRLARSLARRLTADVSPRVRTEANASLRRLASQLDKPMLTMVEKLLFLRQVPTFAACEMDTLCRVAERCVVMRFEAGDVILREGEPGQSFYVVTEGQVAVTAGGRHIDELGPRQYLGEMALFDGRPRSATATALVATTLLRLDRDDFSRLGRESPDLLIGVIRVLSERLRALMDRPGISPEAGTGPIRE